MTDAVLVRAPVALVYRMLTDLDGWPRWLEGASSQRAPGALGTVAVTAPHESSDQHRLRLRLPGPGRPLRLEVSVHSWRHDAGWRWDVRWGPRPSLLPRKVGGRAVSRAGGLVVSAEWWLEACREGVIVHHLVHDVPADGREVRAVRRYRRHVVHGLQALKDHLELAVAHAAGRVP